MPTSSSAYRGDYVQFFGDLLKQDLVRLLASPTEVGAEEHFLPSANQYTKDELVGMAIKLFRDDKVPEDLELYNDDEDDVGRDHRYDDNLQDSGHVSPDRGRNRAAVSRRADTARKSTTGSINVFVSHSSRDERLAKAFVDCLEACMEVPDHAIRCTSVPGYKLLPGDVSDEVLRDNLAQCSIVIGLLTNASLSSGYVIMELGAAWGLEKVTCALLSPEVDASRIPGPLARRHAIRINVDHDIASLIEVIAEAAGLPMRNRARCTAGVNAFLTASKEISLAGHSEPRPPAAGKLQADSVGGRIPQFDRRALERIRDLSGLYSSEDVEVRIDADTRIGEIASGVPIDLLLELAKESASSRRAASAVALGVKAALATEVSEELVETLGSLISDTNERVRFRAMRAALRAEPTRGRLEASIRERLKNEKPWIRERIESLL